ncbi:hypothetical protein PSTT_08716 [Puccinia striiformis]|uniref:SH3 domain-containing protein n=1 Tax=Puccinia striiformis TaxID=27350 RepID=A0A2S4VBA9_9BASI|nr:hypothetical protein PSTT_08716 [Puccinia striiformis]
MTSAQVRISDPGISEAYHRITAADPDIDYMLLSYIGQTNDLKVQDQGTGGLAELQDSWNDGRIQFAFVRVKEAGSGLTKFVLIAWCGDGVLESRKGLFHSHASTVAQFLKGVADSSGAKYSVHNEKPVKREMPAPVGTNYKPIGRPDIASMTSKQKPTPPAPVGTSYTPRKNELAEIRAARTAPSAAPMPARAPVNRNVNEDDFEPTIKATFTPPQPAIPARPPPAQAPAPPKSTQENENEGRPGYVGTAYTPVSLGKPGKLGNRLSAFSTPQEVNPAISAASSGKKMTWAERQALAKNVAAKKKRAVGCYRKEQPGQPDPFGWHEGCCSSSPPSEDDFDAPAPRASESENEDFEPKSSVGTDCGRFPTAAASSASSASTPPDEQTDPVAASTSGSDLKAVVIYDYEQADTDEMGLVEGETIINIEQVDEGWWTGMSADGTRQGLFPATCVSLITEETEANQAEAIAPEAEEEVVEEEEVTATSTPAADKGVHAIAMYDYEAGEDNEITFQETEEIIEIEYSSEDWWTGTVASSGQRGLFPANYVELQEQ